MQFFSFKYNYAPKLILNTFESFQN